MQKVIEIEGKQVYVEVTNKAGNALSKRISPLLVEVELYFSCLIRKKVRFRDLDKEGKGQPVTDKLSLTFRPVMTKVCGKDYEGDEPPLADFPIEKAQPYVPSWVKIDYLRNQWYGEFGYEK